MRFGSALLNRLTISRSQVIRVLATWAHMMPQIGIPFRVMNDEEGGLIAQFSCEIDSYTLRPFIIGMRAVLTF